MERGLPSQACNDDIRKDDFVDVAASVCDVAEVEAVFDGIDVGGIAFCDVEVLFDDGCRDIACFEHVDET